ncbi:tail assembly chaperone [Microbacterium phage Floof]|uniref:Tail assembly chaperone n=1 Tax=Microbacterium phage Floof TaxID=2201433 RepID=A0A2Z4Q4L4_9CAUD|nr:tail assembly chaperone [Microbacterium phage Floof]
MATRKTTNPIAAEATHSHIEFEFDGDTYTTLPSNDWSLDVLEAYEEGKILTALRGILTNDGYARFRKTHASQEDLNSFMVAMQKAQGIAGN